MKSWTNWRPLNAEEVKRNLVKAMDNADVKKARQLQSAAHKIKRHRKYGLGFSVIRTDQNPDCVEKVDLLGIHASLGRLPVCNDGF